eukprot:Clim_evm98s108 gene=Clim_evmTU98s108
MVGRACLSGYADPKRVLNDALAAGYSFLVLPMCHPDSKHINRWRSGVSADFDLDTRQWSDRVVAEIYGGPNVGPPDKPGTVQPHGVLDRVNGHSYVGRPKPFDLSAVANGPTGATGAKDENNAWFKSTDMKNNQNHTDPKENDEQEKFEGAKQEGQQNSKALTEDDLWGPAMQKGMVADINWALHCGCAGILIRVDWANCPPKYIPGIIASVLGPMTGTREIGMWITFPVNDIHSWHIWSSIKTASGGNAHIMPTLLFHEDLKGVVLNGPAHGQTKSEAIDRNGIPFDVAAAMDRWAGEPVGAIEICTDRFIVNRKGVAVLSQFHQKVIARLMPNGARLFLRSSQRSEVLGWGHEEVLEDEPTALHEDYCNYICHNLREARRQELYHKNTGGWEDYLQAPLQPLSDNLQSQTYAVFEQDPIKYQLYKDAIEHCLKGLSSGDDPAVPINERPVMVMVVGAGRGPLVAAALTASQSTGVPITCFAIEKNAGAVPTLNYRNQREWDGKVTVIETDMRRMHPQLKGKRADLLVSELLGSFGDNELSPECLYSAEYHLLREDGRGQSVPLSYTAFAAPVMSLKLRNSLNALVAPSQREPFKNYDTPYVVKAQCAYTFDQAKRCWDFTHPSTLVGSAAGEDWSVQEKYERHCSLTFTAPQEVQLDGFLGYFESRLHPAVLMSTVPQTMSAGMSSWFPIFFPIRHPIHLSAGESINLQIWRRHDHQRVWYEWCFCDAKGLPLSAVQNVNGSSSWMGL